MTQTGDYREYYVVFTDKARLNWFFRLFTAEGFRHCEIYMDVTKDVSMSVCQTIDNIEMTYYHKPIGEVIKYLKRKDAKVLLLQKYKSKRKLLPSLCVPSCVTQCMLLTGVSFNCINVYKYYKRLKEYGAIEL